MKRRICVVTGSRAEYGHLRWVMEGIRKTAGLRLQVAATGAHLSADFGLTYREIEKDGFRIDAKVKILLYGDTPAGITKSVGLGTSRFADVYARLDPDLVVLLGDRYEIFAAAQAAFIAGIGIAHISGGEVTEGALDDTLRHCITKMSRYHFVAAERYRRRVLQLGEQPDCVFNVGDPGLDSIRRLPLLGRKALCADVGLDARRDFLLMTYHPETTGTADAAGGMRELLGALDRFPGLAVLATKSNADAGGQSINRLLDKYAKTHPGRVRVATSLGQLRYLSAMKHCAAVVGNSSSGIVEAPALRVPTVNIGSRQRGRLLASSVIDCAPGHSAIAAAIRRAMSAAFRRKAQRTRSRYGDCNASAQIVRMLARLDASRGLAKQFYDLRRS